MSGSPLRLGLVGAGRTRNGLGPFLARGCEQAGARVVAVSGRDAARAEANAAALGEDLGHPVAAFPTVAALCASRIDALVVASPAEHHLEALHEALQRSLPCLCEKPVVAGAQVKEGVDLALAFASRGLLLLENAIWPHVLPVLLALHGSEKLGPVRSVAMDLSPREGGFRSMVEDSLPHLLSMVHASAPDGARDGLRLLRAEWRQRAADERELAVHFGFAHAGGEVEADLHLLECPRQPRPMRFSVDGREAVRRIGDGYRLSFVGGSREVPVEDPLLTLTRRFVALAAARNSPEAGALARGAAVRLRLFGEALQLLFGA